jgi:hypothetical protein
LFKNLGGFLFSKFQQLAKELDGKLDIAVLNSDPSALLFEFFSYIRSEINQEGEKRRKTANK